MTLPVQIAGAWSGALEKLDGTQLLLRSPKAFPPGQPLELLVDAGTERVALSARAIGSKRRDADWFELRVRLVNLRKDAREALDRVWRSVERG